MDYWRHLACRGFKDAAILDRNFSDEFDQTNAAKSGAIGKWCCADHAKAPFRMRVRESIGGTPWSRYVWWPLTPIDRATLLT